MLVYLVALHRVAGDADDLSTCCLQLGQGVVEGLGLQSVDPPGIQASVTDTRGMLLRRRSMAGSRAEDCTPQQTRALTGWRQCRGVDQPTQRKLLLSDGVAGQHTATSGASCAKDLHRAAGSLVLRVKVENHIFLGPAAGEAAQLHILAILHHGNHHMHAGGSGGREFF